MTIDKNDIDAFVEKSKSTDVPLLITAKEELKRKLKNNPTAQDVTAYAKVNKELSSALSEDKKSISNYQEALYFLQEDLGRKVAKTKLFDDIKLGKLKKATDGSFKISDLKRYAGSLPLIAVPLTKSEKSLQLSEMRMKEEIRKIKAIADREEHALGVKKGLYFPKERLYQEVAARTMIFKTSLSSAVQARCLDLIHIVEGNPQKSIEFTNEFEYLLEDALAEFSKELDIEVVFEVEQDEEMQGDEDE